MSAIVCILCHKKSERCSVQATFCMDCIPIAERIRAIAHRAVKRSIKYGVLPPVDTQYCVDCGRFATGYEHRDYSDLVNVEPICQGCNRKRGPAKYPAHLVKLARKFKADREQAA